MKNILVLSLALISILFVSGCKSKIKETYNFKYTKNTVLEYNSDMSSMEANKKQVRCILYFHGERYRRENEKEIIFTTVDPYKGSFKIYIEKHGKFGNPIDLFLKKGEIVIFQNNNEYKKLDLKLLKPVLFTIEEAEQVRSNVLDYTHSEKFSEFLKNNLIYSKVHEIKVQVEFVGEYEDGTRKNYYAEIIKTPYYIEDALGKTPEALMFLEAL